MDKSKLARKRGLELAERVSELTAGAPDTETKRELYSVVSRIRTRYGLSAGQKRELLIRYLRLGATTLDELSRETLIGKCEISPILKELEGAGLVEQRTFPTLGTGRPLSGFFYIGEEED